MKVLILNKTIGTGESLTSFVSRNIYKELNDSENEVYFSEIRGVLDLEHIIKKIDFDYIFPCFQIGWTESGIIQKICEDKKVKCLFSSSEVVELCHDKTKFKTWAKKNGINIVKSYTKTNVKFPCIKKPKVGEHAATVSVIKEKEEVDDNFIYEEYISKEDGWKEYTVSLLNKEVCYPMYIRKEKEEIWTKNSRESFENYPEKEKVYSLIKTSFEKIYKDLGIKSHCTIDFFVKNEEVKVLEINTNPFLNKDGVFIASIVSKKNISYKQILKEILKNE